MTKTTATATAPATGRGSVARLSDSRRRNTDAIYRAREARRSLRTRQDRFAHLKRVYD